MGDVLTPKPRQELAGFPSSDIKDFGREVLSTSKNTDTIRDLKKMDINDSLGSVGDVKNSDVISNVSGAIRKSQYSGLRKKTPSNDIRKMVNPEGIKIDPVYGYETNVLEADHIVLMKEIVNMTGFSQLSREQQIEVLNLKDNFIGLGKSTNASKGAKNWSEWQGHSRLGKIPSDVRTKMLELDRISREILLKAIEERIKNDKSYKDY